MLKRIKETIDHPFSGGKQPGAQRRIRFQIDLDQNGAGSGVGRRNHLRDLAGKDPLAHRRHANPDGRSRNRGLRPGRIQRGEEAEARGRGGTRMGYR